MSMPYNEFIAMTETPIAKKLFEDKEIAAYIKDWRIENKAALLHANGITTNTPIDEAKGLLQLVAAFTRKDAKRIDTLVNKQNVSVGARLDYFLPLYDKNYQCGEDIFITSTKIILGGTPNDDLKLKQGAMIHRVGPQQNQDYSEQELREIESYVNNAFEIRELLKNAPNQTVIEPNIAALLYIIENAQTYRDTNNNPVIVFIPGAISIPNHPTDVLIEKVLKNGADINAVGFFGVPGIVWSIILADVPAVRKFLEHNAKLDIPDEMNNKNVRAWVKSTLGALSSDDSYLLTKLNSIGFDIKQKLAPKATAHHATLFATTPAISSNNIPVNKQSPVNDMGK